MIYTMVLIILAIIIICCFIKYWGKDFEKHSAKGVITFTLFIAGSTLSVSKFIFFDQKNLAQENRVKSLETQIKMYENKINILEKDLKESLDILKETDGTKIFYKSKISNLEFELKNKDFKITQLQESTEKYNKISPTTEEFLEKYNETYLKYKGESVIDNRSGVIIGINDIDYNYTLTGKIQLGDRTEDIKKASVGTSWENTSNNHSYKIILSKVDWINNSCEIKIIEL